MKIHSLRNNNLNYLIQSINAGILMKILRNYEGMVTKLKIGKLFIETDINQMSKDNRVT